MLANTSVAKLKELAKDYYVKGYSKLNKAALVEVVSCALQKPKRLTELLYVLDTPTFMLFKRAAESQQPIKVKKLQSEQYKLLVDLCYLVCEESQADMVVTVPSQISDVFLQLERGDFSKRKARYDLLNGYAMATVHLYGVISQDDFVDIFNRQNSQKTSIEELFPVLIRHIAVGAPYCFWEEYIVCDELGENDLSAIRAASFSGVALIASIHAGSVHELCCRPLCRGILSLGAFETVALLHGRSAPTKVEKLFLAGDLLENNGGDPDCSVRGDRRVIGIRAAKNA